MSDLVKKIIIGILSIIASILASDLKGIGGRGSDNDDLW